MEKSTFCGGELPDAELVRMAQAGKRRAVWDLVEKYRPLAEQWAYLNLPGIFDEVDRLATAQDVTQEAMVDMWQNLKEFDPKRKFSAWLRGIVKRKCIDEIRDRTREDEVERSDDMAEEECLEILSGADGDLSAYELQDAIGEAIKQLPPMQQAVMKLRRVGYRHKDIAEKLEITGRASSLTTISNKTRYVTLCLSKTIRLVEGTNRGQTSRAPIRS
jgi:RNA polymerase sigma factor (sigma-70 family)